MCLELLQGPGLQGLYIRSKSYVAVSKLPSEPSDNSYSPLLTCFSRDFPFHLFQPLNSYSLLLRSPWSWSHLSKLWSILPWHLCLSKVWVWRLNYWLESFISIGILHPCLWPHGELTLLLCSNLGLAMRLVLANGMSGEMMQTESWNLPTWLGLPSCQCQEENVCQLAPLVWGEWMGQPWTQHALDQSEAQSDSAPISWPQLACTRACDCCFKLLSLRCFIPQHCTKLWLLPSPMSRHREPAREDSKEGQTVLNICSLPFIGRLVLSLS